MMSRTLRPGPACVSFPFRRRRPGRSAIQDAIACRHAFGARAAGRRKAGPRPVGQALVKERPVAIELKLVLQQHAQRQVARTAAVEGGGDERIVRRRDTRSRRRRTCASATASGPLICTLGDAGTGSVPDPKSRPSRSPASYARRTVCSSYTTCASSGACRRRAAAPRPHGRRRRLGPARLEARLAARMAPNPCCW